LGIRYFSSLNAVTPQPTEGRDPERTIAQRFGFALAKQPLRAHIPDLDRKVRS
jgi:hypothetical protein